MKHSTFTILCTLIAVLGITVKHSYAAPRSDISLQAENYLHTLYQQELPLARTVVRVNPLAPSLNKQTCNGPIAFNHAPSSSSRISLKAKCKTPSWTIFLTANIEQWLKIATSSRPLNKGTILGDQDVFFQELDIRRLNKPYFLTQSELIGRELKHTIGRHKAFTPGQLSKQFLIRKGDLVYIEASNTIMQIRMTGNALQDGAMGEQISVKNIRSGKVVRGYVKAKGVISVSH